MARPAGQRKPRRSNCTSFSSGRLAQGTPKKPLRKPLKKPLNLSLAASPQTIDLVVVVRRRDSRHEMNAAYQLVDWRKGRIMERAANMAVIVCCLAVVLEVGYRHLAAGQRGPQGTTAPSDLARDYHIGEKFDRVPGYAPQPGKSTLFLIVKSTCGFCRSSMPFYQELTKAVEQAGHPVTLVGLCLEPTAPCNRFFEEHGVRADAILGVEPGTLRVSGTPTLVLVDADAIVRSTWRGALSPDVERHVVASVIGASN